MTKSIFSFVLLVISHLTLKCQNIQVNFSVLTNSKLRPMKHLWSSTGFSPEIPELHLKQPDQLMEQDVLMNLAFIGSLPKRSINQVRIHWLLDLMTKPFKISKLDSFIHHLWSFDLRPGFEIMGNPGNFFTSDFTGTYMHEC